MSLILGNRDILNLQQHGHAIEFRTRGENHDSAYTIGILQPLLAALILPDMKHHKGFRRNCKEILEPWHVDKRNRTIHRSRDSLYECIGGKIMLSYLEHAKLIR